MGPFRFPQANVVWVLPYLHHVLICPKARPGSIKIKMMGRNCFMGKRIFGPRTAKSVWKLESKINLNPYRQSTSTPVFLLQFSPKNPE
jgi:hypothetical protein